MNLIFHLAFMRRSCRQVGDGPIEYLDGLPPPTEAELDASRAAAQAEWDRQQSPPKTWPDVEHFLGEFTMPEMAAIGLLTDPTIAGLRFFLSGWRSEVHLEDPRVQQGITVLQSAGILTAERVAEISS